MKKILICLALLLLVAAGGAAKLFLIGDPVDGNTVVCHVTENDNQVNIFVSTPASAIAFTNATLHQKNTALHITLRKVLVSPLFNSGSHHIWIEKNDLTEIWLGGKLIWEA